MTLDRHHLLNARRGMRGRGHGATAASPLTLLAQGLDDAEHFLATAEAVDHLVGHAHGDLLAGVGVEQALDQQVAHENADEDAAVAVVLLLGAVVELVELEVDAVEIAQLVDAELGVGAVGAAQAVVVEGDAVDGGDEQERPVGASLGAAEVPVVVDGDEDVGHPGHVGEVVLEGGSIAIPHEEKGHGRPHEDDTGLRVFRENLALKPSEERKMVSYCCLH